MHQFNQITSKAIILEEENVDTDQIVPVRFLKITDKSGLKEALFHDWRYSEDGKKIPSIFNDPEYSKRKVMVVDKNFGIGSSREHVVWALHEFGIRVLIGSSYGDIFYNNCLKNGLLAIKLKQKEIDQIKKIFDLNTNMTLAVDLPHQAVRIDESEYSFSIDTFRKKCLMKGIDDIGYIDKNIAKIKLYEQLIESQNA